MRTHRQSGSSEYWLTDDPENGKAWWKCLIFLLFRGTKYTIYFDPFSWRSINIWLLSMFVANTSVEVLLLFSRSALVLFTCRKFSVKWRAITFALVAQRYFIGTGLFVKATTGIKTRAVSCTEYRFTPFSVVSRKLLDPHQFCSPSGESFFRKSLQRFKRS